MKMGASPFYLLPNQKEKLEEHIENLKSAEKDAYLKLKQSKILTDEQETPTIRVALRNIKDFAIPFKFQERIFWKYAFTSEEEIQKLLIPPIKERKNHENTKTESSVPKAWEVKKTEIHEAKENSKKIENISERKNTATQQKNSSTEKQSFLVEIENFLEKQNIKIIAIEEVDKKNVIAKIVTNSKPALLFAFNKKRIDEQEIIKCYKRAKTSDLPYHIIIRGELAKKTVETMDAYKALLKIDKLND
jgi:hypothetical protein